MSYRRRMNLSGEVGRVLVVHGHQERPVPEMQCYRAATAGPAATRANLPR